MRQIPNYPDYYLLDNGSIFSTRKSGKLRKLKPTYGNTGYVYYTLHNENGYKVCTINAIVKWTVFNCFSKSHKIHINHKDGNKLNNHLDNMELVSIDENNRHALKNKLRIMPKGENNGRAKLTEKQVIEIKGLLNGGVKIVDITKRFNISQGVVSNIKAGRIWKHLNIKEE